MGESNVRVAFYTIALNEEHFVERWYESCKDGDYHLIADTGSTDGTQETARRLGINVIQVNVMPWRFDVARNASLAALPRDIDYCVALDMDEVMVGNWRRELEIAKLNDVTRPRYKFTWNWTEDGKPGLQYGADKIHTRANYRWKHPVHETITPYANFQEKHSWCDFEVHHFADLTKSRSSYLHLLELAVKEDPHDDRNAYYYGRELYYYGRYEEAMKELQRFLLLPTATWGSERAAAYRFMARCRPAEYEYWLHQAMREAPNDREPYIDIAKRYYAERRYKECLEKIERAFQAADRPLEYLTEADAWNHAPYDLAAVCAYNLKEYEKAYHYGKIAAEMQPSDQRLTENLKFYLQAVSS
jgi:glycosyltransferase involved in cell wall biosynthesis